MEYVLHFANNGALFFLIPAVALFLLVRLFWYKRVVYAYSLGAQLKAQNFSSGHRHQVVLFLLRFSLLFGLVLVIGRPQLVDPKSNILVEGIDMVVALDASGSMSARDYGKRGKARFDVAKEEAIRFIEKRKHDPLGLVIFGKDAVSRCPITADKKILTSIVQDLHIGSINPDGTVLSIALLTAANRLKNSKSKTKIIVLLTDGEPSPEDTDPAAAIEVLRRMGIKVYTVGVGSEKGAIVQHPFYGIVRSAGINKKLLVDIANKTGGKFFLAKDQKEMRDIYNTIDRLEKTEYETDMFSRYRELFMIFLWVLLALVLLEIFLSSILWFGI